MQLGHGDPMASQWPIVSQGRMRRGSGTATACPVLPVFRECQVGNNPPFPWAASGLFYLAQIVAANCAMLLIRGQPQDTIREALF